MNNTTYIWFLTLLCGVFSYKKYITEPVENGYDLKTSYPQHHEYKTDPYQFGYEIKDGKGNAHFHKEESDEYNYKKGSYGYTDAYGIYRHVDYIADHEGFRAKIRTNEPGVENEDPADVHIYAEQPPYKLQTLYAKTKYPEQIYTQQHTKYDHPTHHLQQQYRQEKEYHSKTPLQKFQQKNYEEKKYPLQIPAHHLQQQYHEENVYHSKIPDFPVQKELSFQENDYEKKQYSPKIPIQQLQQQYQEEQVYPSKTPIQQQYFEKEEYFSKTPIQPKQYHEEIAYPSKTVIQHYPQQERKEKYHNSIKGKSYKNEHSTWVPIYSPTKSKYASYNH